MTRLLLGLLAGLWLAGQYPASREIPARLLALLRAALAQVGVGW